jgi:hypothetical protein
MRTDQRRIAYGSGAGAPVSLNLAGRACSPPRGDVVRDRRGEPRRGWADAVLLAASVVLAAAFLAADRRTAAPLLPAALLRVSRLRQGTLAAALNTVTTNIG